MTLRECPLDEELQVTGVRLPAAAAFRLHEMGIRLGTVARLTQRAAFGGRVVSVAGSRFALDAGTAALIDVEAVKDSA
jgi:ferrous iron transport protein A